jgi:O-antigen ligase
MKGRKHEKIISILAIPFILNAIILTNSRSAFLSLLLALFLSVFIISSRKIFKTALITLLVAAPLFIYLTDQSFIDRMSTLFKTREALTDTVEAHTLSSGRTEIWSYGFRMAKDYPLGAGPNAFKHLARFYMPPELLTYHPGKKYGIRSAHSSYLQVLVEQGYLGLTIWLLLCGHTVKILYQSFTKLKKVNLEDSFWGYTIFSLHASYLAILIGSLFNSRIYYEFFWWQIALSIVAASLATTIAEQSSNTQQI